MSFIRQDKADNLAQAAAQARDEGHQVFTAQMRGGDWKDNPGRSRPVASTAEMIEGIEAEGWHLDQMTAFPYEKNITIVGVFRRSA